MSEIDYNDAVIKALVEMTCGADFLREHVPAGAGVQPVVDECENFAVALGGAIGHYCGCDCGRSLHPEDPVCNTGEPPEVRVTHISRDFYGDDYTHGRGLRPELQQILLGTSGDPEVLALSLPYRFRYCTTEVPDAFESIMGDSHVFVPPRDPDACIEDIGIDEDYFNRPRGLWLEAGAAVDALSGDTFQNGWSFDLGIGGMAGNGIYFTAGARFSLIPPARQTVLASADTREVGTAYGASGYLEGGWYGIISSAFGVRLHAIFDVGGVWADGGDIQVAPNDYRSDISDLRIRLGPGLALVAWPIEGFTMDFKVQYLATVTDTLLPIHSLFFMLKLGFRLMDF